MHRHKVWIMNLYLLLLWNIGTIQSIISVSYFIKDKENSSYLYRHFDVVEEEIFPADIRVDVALSSVVGTLVYSIDRNMNQFIVTLRDDIQEDSQYGLQVELNAQVILVSFSKLCSPRYGTFDVRDEFRIHIQVNDNITLQCNGGNKESFRNNKQQQINYNYPIMFLESTRSIVQPNSAHLWLVNHPKIGNVLPNNHQMYGCIFDVLYKDQSIEFTNISSNIVPNCKKACTNEMCNGGECLVTYSTDTTCNCTTAFFNGRLCSDDMRTQNIRATSQSIMTKIFKLSWNSDSSEIMELKNDFLRISISRQDSNLIFEYDYSNNKSSKIILANDYVPNKNSICIVFFHKNQVDIRVYNNFLWKRITFDCLSDFGDETFHTITLRSGKGVIDIVTRNHTEYQWSTLNVKNPKNIEGQSRAQAIIIAVSVILLCLLITFAILVFYCWKRKMRYPHKYIETEEPFIVMENTQGIPLGGIRFIVENIGERIMRRNQPVHSQYFYSHKSGYKVRLQVYPGGTDEVPTHMGVYMQICKGDDDDDLSWPCRHYFDISIVNQWNNSTYTSQTLSYDNVDDNYKYCYNKPISDHNMGVGSQSFIGLEDLRFVDGIIAHDSIVIKCVVQPPLIIATDFMTRMSLTTVTVGNFTDRMNCINSDIYSPYFNSHENGYKLRLQISPGGYKDVPTHMAVYIQICKSDNDGSLPWPCKQFFNIAIVNQRDNSTYTAEIYSHDFNGDGCKECFNKPVLEYNIGIGSRAFISHSDIRSIDGLLVDDCIILKCFVRP